MKKSLTMICLWLQAGFVILPIYFAICFTLADGLRLVQVHTIYRHGDRTPSPQTYPNDPYINYTYYPMGRGQMTNGGKLRTYQQGKFLKLRYGDFLGPVYTPEVIVSRSSDYDRTKMSIQLILAALYPPECIQRWNDELRWQPIPTVYSILTEDILLNPQFCSSAYNTEFNRILNTPEVLEKIAQFRELMTSLEELTGQTINDTLTLFLLYYTLEGQLAAGLTLPDWVSEFWDGIVNGTILHLELMSYNNDLKRKLGGTILRQITDDVARYANGTLEKGRKFFHYSAHAVNIASLQAVLGVYQPHLPAYTSMVILEIWQRDFSDRLFVKVLYYTGIPATLYTQQIPGCDELCPFDTFRELLEPVTATDSDLICDFSAAPPRAMNPIRNCKKYTYTMGRSQKPFIGESLSSILRDSTSNNKKKLKKNTFVRSIMSNGFEFLIASVY